MTLLLVSVYNWNGLLSNYFLVVKPQKPSWKPVALVK